MSESNSEQLAQLVAELSARLDAAEAELKELRKRSDASIPEDVIIAISAAVSASWVIAARLRQSITPAKERGQRRDVRKSSITFRVSCRHPKVEGKT